MGSQTVAESPVLTIPQFLLDVLRIGMGLRQVTHSSVLTHPAVTRPFLSQLSTLRGIGNGLLFFVYLNSTQNV